MTRTAEFPDAAAFAAPSPGEACRPLDAESVTRRVVPRSPDLAPPPVENLPPDFEGLMIKGVKVAS